MEIFQEIIKFPPVVIGILSIILCTIMAVRRYRIITVLMRRIGKNSPELKFRVWLRYIILQAATMLVAVVYFVLTLDLVSGDPSSTVLITGLCLLILPLAAISFISPFPRELEPRGKELKKKTFMRL